MILYGGTGYNSYGQLGLGDTNGRNTFTQITTNTNDIKSVYYEKIYSFYVNYIKLIKKEVI